MANILVILSISCATYQRTLLEDPSVLQSLGSKAADASARCTNEVRKASFEDERRWRGNGWGRFDEISAHV